MASSNYTVKRTILGRLKHGGDLLGEITRIVNDEHITMGTIMGIGGLKRAAVAFLNQTTKEYERIEIEESLEIVSLTGTISRMKQRSFPHVHVALSDRAGHMYGGHLVQGCEIWACEVVITELEGGVLSRDFDADTGLSLWPKESQL